jgi:L-alanine-DL-glutamate epimerase-like enolase superfamily enzyme
MIKASVENHSFALKEPFAITGHIWHETETLRITLSYDGKTGRGEAVGVYYLGETMDSMIDDAQRALSAAGDRLSLEYLQDLLPRGGARNAIDCALWDLRCKLEGRRIWEILDIAPQVLTTVFTLSIAEPDELRAKAIAAGAVKTLKLKLNAENPVAKVEAVRHARPDAQIIVDVNQGWTFDMLRDYGPALSALGVAMIEQPLARGQDQGLADYQSPIPLAADESCLDTSELGEAAAYDIINIKLDKTGGLTEALKLVQAAKAAGKELMIGNMSGSSLSMAPSWVVAHACRFIDLDGPLLIQKDIDGAIAYSPEGAMSTPIANLWG